MVLFKDTPSFQSYLWAKIVRKKPKPGHQTPIVYVRDFTLFTLQQLVIVSLVRHHKKCTALICLDDLIWFAPMYTAGQNKLYIFLSVLWTLSRPEWNWRQEHNRAMASSLWKERFIVQESKSRYRTARGGPSKDSPLSWVALATTAVTVQSACYCYY